MFHVLTYFHMPRNAERSKNSSSADVRNTSDVLRALERALRARLPEAWEVEVTPAERVGGRIADAITVFTSPDGTRGACVVEAKVRIEGRDLDQALRQARLFTVDLPVASAGRAEPLIAARFLSRRVRQELEERGASYFDTTGNMRIVLERPGLFIADTGEDKDPAPVDTGLRSLEGPAAARVIRDLFGEAPPIKVRDVAGRSGTSLGTASRVLALLEREGVVEREAGTVVAVDRTNLIERWVEDYSFSGSNSTWLFLEPRSLDNLLGKLRSASFRYAVTGSFAAREVVEYAQAKLAMVYVEDILVAEQELGLVRVPSGGNVLLAVPSDKGLLDASWDRDGLRFAPLAQVAADLLTSPGRGPAEGEELLRQLETTKGEELMRQLEMPVA